MDENASILFKVREHGTEPDEAVWDITGDYYELVVPLGFGECISTVDGKPLYKGTISPGMLFLASPNELTRVVGTRPSRAVDLRIPGDRLRAILRAIDPKRKPGDAPFIDHIATPSHEIARLGKLLLKARTLKRPLDTVFVDGIAQSLIALLLGSSSRSHSAGSYSRSGLTPLQLERCIAYAKSSTESGLDLNAWASQIGLGATEFARRFAQSMNQSPYSWFMELRIERAKALLDGSPADLCDIAQQLGFSSQSHFTEAFRRRVGISPGFWRREHRRV